MCIRVRDKRRRICARRGYRAQNNYEMLIKTIHVLIVIDDNNTCPYAKNQIYQIAFHDDATKYACLKRSTRRRGLECISENSSSCIIKLCSLLSH